MVLAAVSALILSSPVSAANAAPPLNPDRIRLPIVAGTKLNGDAGSCTAGAVLQYDFYQLLPAGFAAKATRYVVTAKHCFAVGEIVRVGGVPVGHVIEQAEHADLELVEIDAKLDPSAGLHCATHGSHPAFCAHNYYVPRATGEIITNSGGHPRRMPVEGHTEAPAGRFCTSGYFTGVQCDWTSFRGPEPQPSHGDIHSLKAAESPVLGTTDAGDSGGPVYTYDRELIGINSQSAYFGSILFYVPFSFVFSNFPGYSLATNR
ncbi:hypothetical protein ACR8AL_14060 [Clavibacter sepedonicus]|uniref:hypothetical protein n=1 Tax=Clavibacter sepedonicus TaxID=31964 RepID=UPI0006744947|nr:hypothetical protein [Clavibacter sepedonicus]OQJ48489.1 hypothetical protein B5P19_09610 [Clavibacter sepedonicus]OQJ53971.1 hypothetical protein B5P20_07450 [Clavibacter sepedonicus]UUK65500.1 S1 family peptidase [Clavibacter sepedonicus]